MSDDRTAYVPKANQPCPPATDLLRSSPIGPAQTLHPNETSYIHDRESVTDDAWKAWLGDGSGIGYDMTKFNKTFPRVGIAVSGGGFRAAQYGAGVISALDARNETAKNAGTGGLLQVSSYISALSGGSWYLTSLIFNGFPTSYDLVLGNADSGGQLHGWLLDFDLFIPGGGNIFDKENQWLYGEVLDEVYKKADAHFDTSITDPWSRMLAYHFLNGTTRENFFTNDTQHGAGILWSNLPNTDAFSTKQLPFPLVVAASRFAGSGYNKTNTPLLWPMYEFGPFEFGSWDPDISAFTDVSIIGSYLNQGEPRNSTSCVTGFDQAAFIMGTSSSLFNSILDEGNKRIKGFAPNDEAAMVEVFRRLTSRVQTQQNDVAVYPNPFLGHQIRQFKDGSSDHLELIDGGSNKENIPLGPLLVDAREIDTIFAIDGTNDDPNRWPFGDSLFASRNRTRDFLDATHQPMPPLPAELGDFVKYGLNQRPTFFGCDPQANIPDFPLLVWLPNSPPVDGSAPLTNVDTFNLRYTLKHSQLFLDNAQSNTIAGFVPGKTGADPNFPKCLQCAAIDRGRWQGNTTIPRSDFCTTCFKQYCFDPNNPPPTGQIVGRNYKFKDPDNSLRGFVQDNKAGFAGVLVGSAVVVAALGAGIWFWRKRSQAKKSARYRQVVGEDVDAPWRARGTSFEMPRASPH
ncbi:lysophospholipase catalytic domain-containing protein [Auriculariales sp. MPI-PUGE-AT-0066]|nr:lysophospholipase catalytic domain-containing protein [Auriculariales sp. MPI-PUGE-AT-0066]